ncbi:MAG: C2 domain-containing protein, partial [Bacteroidota bacterium]
RQHHYLYFMNNTGIFFLIMLASALLVSCKGAKQTAEAGPTFRTRKVLRGVEITSVVITEMPRYGGNGEKWDAWAPGAQAPDVYIRFVQMENMVMTTETIQDYAFDKPISFTAGLPASIKAFTTDIRLEVFDEDGLSADDNVGYFTFNLMDYKKKDQILLANADGTLRLELGLRWIYGE